MAGNPHIEFAGDFNLENIVIHNHEDTLAVDIKFLHHVFNIGTQSFVRDSVVLVVVKYNAW